VTNLQIALQYCDDVITGKRINSLYVKQACQRFKDDLANPKYYYDASAVDEVIGFLNELPLADEFSNSKFLLEPWQVLFVCAIYGIKIKETKLRKHKKVLLQIPRKNGKSMLISGLAMYHLVILDNQEILCAANTTFQVRDVLFKMMTEFSKFLDPKKKRLKRFYNSIKYNKNNLYAVSSDASTKDGYNISIALLDEVEEAVSSAMYDVCRSSQASRTEPLIFLIMTAGFDRTNFAFEIRQHCIDMLAGTVADDSQLAFLYGLDPDDPSDYWEKEEAIWKANPNAGVSVQVGFIKDEVATAITNPIQSHSVKVKHFNLWQESLSPETEYIKDQDIQDAMEVLEYPTDRYIWIGLDLAATQDITAMTALWFDDDNRLCFKNKYYLPEVNINTNANKDAYRQWASLGYITLTPGNVCDYAKIEEDIIEIGRGNEIVVVAYDKWNSTQLIIDLTNSYITCKPVSQSLSAMNNPTKELQRLLLLKRVVLDKNPVTRWMYSNVVITMSSEDNIKPKKKNKNDKIDGVYSTLTCFLGFIENPTANHSIY
jgi:phage terminase large subunit-like protein